MNSWHATVRWADGRPVAAELTDDGYRPRGTLDIHGTRRSRVVDLRVGFGGDGPR